MENPGFSTFDGIKNQDMASAFGHAFAAFACSSVLPLNTQKQPWKLVVLGMLCAVWPDADVAGFAFGIPYDSLWGHRGLTHSLLFAILTGLSITLVFYGSRKLPEKLKYFSYFTLCTASHGLLDAMTTGGLGVAFFSPFDKARYFFPFRPILVSPISPSGFFSAWGMAVIKSEMIWIGLPGLALMLIVRLIKKRQAF